MKQVFCEMPILQKIDVIGNILDLGFEIQSELIPVLAQKPYASAFTLNQATIESFKELDDLFDGYKTFDAAVEATILYEIE